MFKKIRIQHVGFHRIGIVIGIFFIFLTPWFIISLDVGNLLPFDVVNLIIYHSDFIEEAIYNFIKWQELYLIIYIIFSYPLSYFVGYFFVKLIYWIIGGFKKN